MAASVSHGEEAGRTCRRTALTNPRCRGPARATVSDTAAWATAPSAAATAHPSFHVPTTVPGAATRPGAAGATDARYTFSTRPLKRVVAPGSGARALTERTTASAGRSHTIH